MTESTAYGTVCPPYSIPYVIHWLNEFTESISYDTVCMFSGSYHMVHYDMTMWGHLVLKPGRQNIPWDIWFWSQAGRIFYETFNLKLQYRCSMGHSFQSFNTDLLWDICFWSQAGRMFCGTSVFKTRQAGCSMGHLVQNIPWDIHFEASIQMFHVGPLVLKLGRQDVPWDIHFEASIQMFHGTSVFEARQAGCSVGHPFLKPGRQDVPWDI